MIRQEREKIAADLKAAVDSTRNLIAVYGEEALEVLRNPETSIPERKDALRLRTRILLMQNPLRPK